MTVKKAVKILEELSNHFDTYSKVWMEKSDSFNTADMKETTKMMGDIMNRDSQIIKMAINELKPEKKSSKTSKESLTQEMKKEITKIIKKEIIEHKSPPLPKRLKIHASSKIK